MPVPLNTVAGKFTLTTNGLLMKDPTPVKIYNVTQKCQYRTDGSVGETYLRLYGRVRNQIT